MGDEVKFGTSNGFISFDGGGTYEPLGEVSEFDIGVSDDEVEAWADALLSIVNEPMLGTLSFKLPWYWSWRHLRRFELPFGDDLFWRLAGSRPRYTIRDLRRGGKSHKGKERRR